MKKEKVVFRFILKRKKADMSFLIAGWIYIHSLGSTYYFLYLDTIERSEWWVEGIY